MTRRKLTGMSWESWIDRQIRESEERGEFLNLPGAGEPIPDDQEPYDPNWWLKKFVAREGLSVLPPGLALRRDVERELTRIRALPSLPQVRYELAKLNRHIREQNARIVTGPPSNITEIQEGDLGWRPTERSPDRPRIRGGTGGWSAPQIPRAWSIAGLLTLALLAIWKLLA